MLREIRRILKPGGLLYISTVVRKRYGIWICWRKGFKLDLTHVREYKSKEEFFRLLEESGFTVKEYRIHPVKYPVIDLILKALIKLNTVKPDPAFYQGHKLASEMRKIKNKG